MELCPPGGACNRVEERSLIMLPQFWLLPFAHLFEDTGASSAPPKMFKLELPPGACCILIPERCAMLFEFCGWRKS